MDMHIGKTGDEILTPTVDHQGPLRRPVTLSDRDDPIPTREHPHSKSRGRARSVDEGKVLEEDWRVLRPCARCQQQEEKDHLQMVAERRKGGRKNNVRQIYLHS